MPSRRRRTLVVALAVGAALLSACGGDEPDVEPPASPPSGLRTVFEDEEGHTIVPVVASEYAFTPRSIGVTEEVVAETVDRSFSLEVLNDGEERHNVSVPAQGVDVDVPPGETVSVVVMVPRGGSIRFLCRFHGARGMAGVIEVVDPPLTETS